MFDNLFKQLDKEEEMEEQVGTTHFQPPPFGDAGSSKEQVYAFYEYWSQSATMK